MKKIDKLLNSNEKKIILLIFLAALVLRLIPVIPFASASSELLADAGEYDKLAMNLISGRGFVNSDTGLATSTRVPIYPMFLAFIYFLFGHSYFAVRVIQCILSASVCVIIFYIGKIAFDRKVGLLSAIILACYQPYILYSYYGGSAFLLSENLFIFLLSIFLLFAMKNYFVMPGIKNSLILGALMGLLMLTRPIFAPFPIFLFFLLWYKNTFFQAAKRMLFVLAFLILTLSPWIVRNYFVHNAFIPFSTQGGFSLYTANNPLASGGGLTNLNDLHTEEELAKFNRMPEVQRDKIYRSYAKEFLFKNYRKIPKLFLKKLLAMWDPFDTNYGLEVERKYNIWYSIIFIFALFGIVKTLKSKMSINSLSLVILFPYFSFSALIFAGEPRYRYPIEVYLIIFASVGVFAILNRYRRKMLPSLLICFIVGVNLLCYVYSDSLLKSVRISLDSLGLR